MIRPGLVSITFRQLSPAAIAALVARAGGGGIEWGGDLHVPHGDLSAAEQVRTITADAGLAVAAYGSYYRAAVSEPDLAFDAVLETALALGAPVIRVWAGNQGSDAATPERRAAVGDDLGRIAAMAADAGVTVALEYHANTLTDTAASACRLLADVNHPNLLTCWQPPNNQHAAVCRESLQAVLPHLANLHVFVWHYDTGRCVRKPLADGADRWQPYLELARTAPGERWALVEFVRGDDPDQYLADARALQQWLAAFTP